MTGGRTMFAGYALLDRQILDADGRLAGNVDDLEITVPEDGSPPYVSAILSGRGALAEQLGGRLGRFLAALSRRLVPGNEPPGRIPFGVVKRVGSAIEVSVQADDLDNAAVEHWVRDTFIAKIPGAHHEAE